MCTNWKRFTLKAIILASLSLFLYGCSGGGTSDAPALREVRGVVSDSTGGKPFANAAVTAYAIDAAGNVSTTPLSATVQSDGQGNFILKIPEGYVGGIKFVATETTGTGTIALSSVLPSVAPGQVVVISPATDMVSQYITANMGGSFTAENIQKATLVLEPFLGLNFTQIPPPLPGAALTPAQQQLVVMIQAINSLITPTNTIADMVTVNPATGIMHLGEGALFTALNAAIVASTADLIGAGVIPGTFTPPVIIPVPEPDPTDVTAPSAPQNLKATPTASSITLSWDAATDNVGVTAYYVYRNNVLFSTVAAPTLTYTDTAVNAATSYTYEVKARDAAGNVSAGSTIPVTTLPILTYTISGRITSNGTGLSSVFVAVSGSGTGVVLTDADGNYTFTGVRAGSYVITPTLIGFAFTPVNRPVDVTTASVTGMDFAAVPLTPGTVTGVTTYPDGTVTITTTYPDGTVTTLTTYPNGTVTIGITYPNGTVTTSTTYPNGTVTTSLVYPA